MSRTINSGRNDAAICKADSPSSAVRTSYPSSSRSIARDQLESGSSSTIRTRRRQAAALGGSLPATSAREGTRLPLIGPPDVLASMTLSESGTDSKCYPFNPSYVVSEGGIPCDCRQEAPTRERLVVRWQMTRSWPMFEAQDNSGENHGRHHKARRIRPCPNRS